MHWEAVPQPDGTWLVKEPSTHHQFTSGVIGTKCGRIIARVLKKDDATLILRAVNCHADLLAACKGLLAWLDKMARTARDESEQRYIINCQPPDFCLNDAKTAIAKAEEQKP